MSLATLTLETDIEILEAYKTGERDRAITAFVRRHQRFVYAIALRHLSNSEDARDASQEVFLKALKGLDRFKGDSSLQTWLYRITVNVCNSQLRKRRLLSFFTVGEGEGERDVAARQLDPLQHAEQSDFEVFFNQVLKTLPPKQRETFCLRYYDELSYEEISTMVGTSEGALKANYHWAVKKIAEKLRNSEFYEKWSEHEA
jgi:RNA polymerase sigma factor (sigma-70 family)